MVTIAARTAASPSSFVLTFTPYHQRVNGVNVRQGRDPPPQQERISGLVASSSIDRYWTRTSQAGRVLLKAARMRPAIPTFGIGQIPNEGNAGGHLSPGPPNPVGSSSHGDPPARPVQLCWTGSWPGAIPQLKLRNCWVLRISCCYSSRKCTRPQS